MSLYNKRHNKTLFEGIVCDCETIKIDKCCAIASVEGLTKRLAKYSKHVNSEKGKDKPLVDYTVMSKILQYANSKKKILSEINYLKNLKDSNGIKFSRNFQQPKQVIDALKRFGQENSSSFKWNKHYQAAYAKIKEMLSKHKLNPVTYTCDDDIKETLPKLDTHSGMTYLETGNKEKGDNIKGVYQRYTKFVLSLKSDHPQERLIMIGFRNQASGEYDINGERTYTCKHKTRLISMIDLLVIILECKFAVPFQCYLATFQFYAGGKDDNDIYQFISQCRYKLKYWLSIDYTAYDQSISAWLIKDAFQLIKDVFVLNEDDSKLFDIMVNMFVNKRFILDDENCLISKKGIPSGSMFTQIIGTICNLLMVYTYLNSINEKYLPMMIMSDDNVLFHSNPELSKESLASYLVHNFGVSINPDKTMVGNTEEPVEFLSRLWGSTGPFRSFNLLLSRMLYPERFRNYSNKQLKPELIIYSYYLISKRTMLENIDIERLMFDYPNVKVEAENLGSQYLPGSIMYNREYILKKRKRLSNFLHS